MWKSSTKRKDPPISGVISIGSNKFCFSASNVNAPLRLFYNSVNVIVRNRPITIEYEENSQL